LHDGSELKAFILCKCICIGMGAVVIGLYSLHWHGCTDCAAIHVIERVLSAELARVPSCMFVECTLCISRSTESTYLETSDLMNQSGSALSTVPRYSRSRLGLI